MNENLEYMDPDDVDIFGPPILSWTSLSKMNFPNQDWRIAGLVPESGVTLLAGVSGEKKTWLAMYMAYCMATGSHLFGSNQFPVKKSKVLYFDAEMAPSEFQRRGKLLQFDNIPAEDLQAIVGYDFSIREDHKFDLLKDQIEVHGFNVIIIDTLRGVAGGIPEDKAEEIRPFMNKFKSLKNQGISVIILDHTRKPQKNEGYAPKKEQILGSQDKVASAESVIMIRSELHADAFTVYPVKNRTGLELKPFMVTMLQVGSKIEFRYEGNFDEQTTKFDIAMLMIPQIIGNSTLTTSQIIKIMQDEHSVAERNVRQVLRHLVGKDQLVQEKVKREYTYKNTENALLLLKATNE